MCLINGTTITREPVVAVTYWHVELDAHDILLAEGLPAESYLDWATGRSSRKPPTTPCTTPTSSRRALCPLPAGSGRGPVVEAERARLSGVLAVRSPRIAPGYEAGRFTWIAA